MSDKIQRRGFFGRVLGRLAALGVGAAGLSHTASAATTAGAAEAAITHGLVTGGASENKWMRAGKKAGARIEAGDMVFRDCASGLGTTDPGDGNIFAGVAVEADSGRSVLVMQPDMMAAANVDLPSCYAGSRRG